MCTRSMQTRAHQHTSAHTCLIQNAPCRVTCGIGLRSTWSLPGLRACEESCAWLLEPEGLRAEGGCRVELWGRLTDSSFPIVQFLVKGIWWILSIYIYICKYMINKYMPRAALRFVSWLSGLRQRFLLALALRHVACRRQFIVYAFRLRGETFLTPFEWRGAELRLCLGPWILA